MQWQPPIWEAACVDHLWTRYSCDSFLLKGYICYICPPLSTMHLVTISALYSGCVGAAVPNRTVVVSARDYYAR